MQSEAGAGIRTDYTAPQKWLHWLHAAMILTLIPVGIVMSDAPEPTPTVNAMYELHKSFGILVFVLAVLRVAYRVGRGAPAYPADMPEAQRKTAAAVHHLLYALIFITPALGFIGTSMCCKPVNLFWTVPVPFGFSGSEATIKAVFTAHKITAITMAVLVVGHIGAALYHGLVRKDGLLRRMLPHRG